ncbi:LacI family DNA-binding transcriptional regulator [Limibaculum sp. FT325]|uniref:LacI family DNA-binding transcriptional regulator n=1 Tax=Thermohalobaculum sediminis TaxID=2939436 RepID=UPI0020C053B0|nr:LacI family DNA-binding transcriptional regulator [Limibaculum sediminis]MCL5777563.1 LacI family DNA-binding transcriptional regulator [Limibaculum sediminis]
MKPQPTLEDVARASGVSTATVSRVLNDSARVRRETCERVEAAIARLGYTPHFGGRMLASNRTDTIGAVIPTMENAIFARGLQTLEEELAAAGVTLLVATSNYDPAREARQIRALLGRGIDGLVLIGEARDPESYELLRRRGMPFVVVWTWRADCPWTCIGFDNRAAARGLADRVLDLGHRRIAMISGITLGNDRAAARLAGVREAMAARGLALDAGNLVEAAYTLEAGREAAARLLARAPRPTAIICGNDVLAAGAMLAIRVAGLRVPRDVSVTGFDDIELAQLLDPPLTTVRVPHRLMGQTAARVLLRMRAGEDGVESAMFGTTLVDRGSLQPPG